VIFPWEIAVAVAIDVIIGDPRRLPHPVRWIGTYAAWTETWTTRVFAERAVAGVVTWLTVVATVAVASYAVVYGAGLAAPGIASAVRVIMLYYTIAPRDLISHAVTVRRRLRTDDLSGARTATGMLVSRDTATSTREELIRATVESVAENTSDATVAPLLFAAFGGPVAAFVYRAINTLDAMFGYRNARYIDFGRVSAKADDVANWVPARITGILTCLSAACLGMDAKRAFRTILRDARKHDSPNAGYPEAAAAGALGVAFGGKASYFGRTVEKPLIGDAVRPYSTEDITRVVRLSAVTVLWATAIAVGVRFVGWNSSDLYSASGYDTVVSLLVWYPALRIALAIWSR
jgi:adenosylcobinamide-phosphate synthase